MFPGTRPTLLETLATMGGKPNASRVGKVIRDPDPTIALTAPAAMPAPRIPRASAGPIGASHDVDHIQVHSGRFRRQASVKRAVVPAPTSARSAARPAAARQSTGTGS